MKTEKRIIQKPMKTLNKLVMLVLVTFSMMGCQIKSGQITHQKDYNKYLMLKENKSIDFTKGEIEFWQKKYDAAPNQTSYLGQIAANYAKLFEITGNIDYLYKSEALLLKSNESLLYTNAGTIRSLARNYISQHRFKEALILAHKAFVLDDAKETQKLLFDVNFELGNYAEVQKNLESIKDLNNYDYLIRSAKWNDHKGDLKSAIYFMEKAKFQAESNDNKALEIWTYSNLGDLNGHAGNIKASYDYYLKTLALAPNNTYVMKGIAWIVFSHEKNTKEARRIIDIISKKHDTPDFYLLKSKIAEYENNAPAKKESLDKYFKMLADHNYGAMYNRYNTLIYADDKMTASKALEIAKIEVDHRPTPDSYDLLAWSYYNLGDVKRALDIEQRFVFGKSQEPMLKYHQAVIYKANNKTEVIIPIKKALQASIFELGPSYDKKIAQL